MQAEEGAGEGLFAAHRRAGRDDGPSPGCVLPAGCRSSGVTFSCRFCRSQHCPLLLQSGLCRFCRSHHHGQDTFRIHFKFCRVPEVGCQKGGARIRGARKGVPEVGRQKKGCHFYAGCPSSSPSSARGHGLPWVPYARVRVCSTWTARGALPAMRHSLTSTLSLSSWVRSPRNEESRPNNSAAFCSGAVLWNDSEYLFEACGRLGWSSALRETGATQQAVRPCHVLACWV